MTSIFKAVVVAIAIAGGATASSAATLIGNTIEAVYYFPDLGTPYVASTVTPNPFMVGSGVDATIDIEGVTDLLIDFSASSLLITLETVLTAPVWNAAAQNGPVFTVVTGSPFTTVSSVVSTGVGPVAAYLLGGELIVNWAGMKYFDGTTVTIEFAASAIPLPASLGFIGLGLGALGWVGRRRHAV